MPTAIVGWFGRRLGGGIAATPGYSIFLTPWAGVKAVGNFDSRAQDVAALGGGYWYNSAGALNDQYNPGDIWLDAGTFKYAQFHLQDTNRGIYSVQLDTVEQGQIDGYGTSSLYTYSEITGIAVTTGLKVFLLKMAAKHASSTGYYGTHMTCAWIRTGP